MLKRIQLVIAFMKTIVIMWLFELLMTSNKKIKYDVTWILTTVTTTTGLFNIHMYPGVGFVFQQLEMKKKTTKQARPNLINDSAHYKLHSLNSEL